MRIQDALRIMLDACEPPGVVRLPVAAAAGRVTVSDVVARADAPAQPRAVTDGFLVRPEDCAGATPEAPTRLDLAPALVGNDGPGPRRGHAWPVQAGAVVPDAGLAVLPQHAAQRSAGHLLVRRPPEPGLNILPPGGIVARNDVILKAGEVITPPAVGAMTAAGVSEVDVFRRPRVLLLSVSGGDEAPGAARPGDGNLSMLAAAVTQAGCDVVHTAAVAPDATALTGIFRRVLDEDVDVVICAGGTVPGAEGVAAEAWRAVGGHVLVDALDCRPGRSFLAGLHTHTWLVVLSPAPAASLAVFALLVRPFLLRLAGRERVVPPVVRARLTAGCPCDPRYTRLVWARLRGPGPFTAEPAVDPDRGRLYYPVNANSLLLLPPGPGLLSGNQYAWAVWLDGQEAAGAAGRLLPVEPARPLVFAVAGAPGPQRRAVLERLGHALAGEGLQVAVVRRVAGGLSWNAVDTGLTSPPPGEWLTVVAPEASLLYEAGDLPGSTDEDRLGRLLDRLTATRHVPDVVLVEGFSGSDLPKVWVGPARDDVEITNVVAAVRTSRGAIHLPGVPVFLDDDALPLVELVLGAPGAGEDGDDDDVF
ncbi:MAG: molybdopterin-binding protein [Thermaerobacter sp.]|nr:hypothetical protein [Bacillota bacterium]